MYKNTKIIIHLESAVFCGMERTKRIHKRINRQYWCQALPTLAWTVLSSALLYRGFIGPSDHTYHWRHHRKRNALILFSNSASLPGDRPVISTQPSDLVAERRLPATLSCQATGKKPITIQWLHNGKPVFKNGQDNDGRRYHKSNDDLYFTRVVARRDENDGGVYQCVATNSYGSTSSRNATLIVGGAYSWWFLLPSECTYCTLRWQPHDKLGAGLDAVTTTVANATNIAAIAT